MANKSLPRITPAQHAFKVGARAGYMKEGIETAEKEAIATGAIQSPYQLGMFRKGFAVGRFNDGVEYLTYLHRDFLKTDQIKALADQIKALGDDWYKQLTGGNRDK